MSAKLLLVFSHFRFIGGHLHHISKTELEYSNVQFILLHYCARTLQDRDAQRHPDEAVSVCWQRRPAHGNHAHVAAQKRSDLAEHNPVAKRRPPPALIPSNTIIEILIYNKS